jgi:hypothetical protein
MEELFPFDDINFGLDEQWARIYPYGQKTLAGESLTFSVKIFNHSFKEKTFKLEPIRTDDFEIEPKSASLVIGPKCEGNQEFKVKVSKNVSPGTSLLVVSLQFDGWDLHEWCEGVIEILK